MRRSRFHMVWSVDTFPSRHQSLRPLEDPGSCLAWQMHHIGDTLGDSVRAQATHSACPFGAKAVPILSHHNCSGIQKYPVLCSAAAIETEEFTRANMNFSRRRGSWRSQGGQDPHDGNRSGTWRICRALFMDSGKDAEVSISAPFPRTANYSLFNTILHTRYTTPRRILGTEQP